MSEYQRIAERLRVLAQTLTGLTVEHELMQLADEVLKLGMPTDEKESVGIAQQKIVYFAGIKCTFEVE